VILQNVEGGDKTQKEGVIVLSLRYSAARTFKLFAVTMIGRVLPAFDLFPSS